MINWSENRGSLVGFWAYCCLLTWWVSDHVFFWDTVQLASKHAHWYYEQNFQYLLLPETIDSGHPPIFGMYLAICWKIFGKSLMVSHFSMLPFLLGIVWLLHKIGIYYGDNTAAKYLILLVLIDPFFAGQSVLVSPDIVLVFAFSWCIFSILHQHTIGIILGTILLGTISMRGMMVTLGLYLWWILTLYFQTNKSSATPKQLLSIAYQKLPYFLPSGLLAILFLGFHYQETGWIGYHPNSPWAGSFKQVDLNGFLKNIGLLGWRLLDFGRLFLLGSLLFILFKGIKSNFQKGLPHSSLQRGKSSAQTKILDKKIKLPAHQASNKNLKIKSLFTLILVLSLLLTPSLLLHEGLMSHRYLLPITLSITLFFYHLWVVFFNKKKTRQIIFSIAFLGLLTGNLWVYPKHIAQGWDATLAHLPYYELRNKMMQYIEQKGIPLDEVGTVFPNIGPLEIYNLKGQTTGFVKKDFSKNKYFFYSVVYNDVSDEELKELENDWVVLKEFKAYGITVILYKK